jgi:hypothetical protein
MNAHRRGGPSTSAPSLAMLIIAFLLGWAHFEPAVAQGLPTELGPQGPLSLWVIGVVVLGMAIAYGIMRNRNRTRAERAAADQATKDLYARENRDNSGR